MQPPFTTLQAWLGWLEQLHPREIDLGRERIRRVAQQLNISSAGAQLISVAGTNGKGSCVETLQQLLLADGHRVGAYTSPHILRYNERIRINGECVSDQALCEVFAEINQARGDISLTYFEFGTLAAFLLFQRTQLDYWVCEIGLGGRLDAVNILPPDVAVITSIDMDHEQWLGDTREKIAFEKLGIVREGALCICAEPNPTPNMAEIFAERRARVFQWGAQFAVDCENGEWQFRLTSERAGVLTLTTPALQLPPGSVAAALQVLLREGDLTDALRYQRQLAKLCLAGRFERRYVDGVDVVLDVAHNPAAGAMLANLVASRLSTQVVAVVAMMADKRIVDTLTPLRTQVEHWFVGQFSDLPRAADSARMCESLQLAGVDIAHVTRCESVTHAFAAALQRARQKRAEGEMLTVLCFGSFFTVAEVSALLEKHTLERAS